MEEIIVQIAESLFYHCYYDLDHCYYDPSGGLADSEMLRVRYLEEHFGHAQAGDLISRAFISVFDIGNIRWGMRGYRPQGSIPGPRDQASPRLLSLRSVTLA